MKISVIDSASGMRSILGSPPDDRDRAVRDLWSSMAGMYQFIPGEVDMASVHAQNFGFPTDPTSQTEQLIRDGLAALESADAWNRVGDAVRDGISCLTSAHPDLDIPDLQVLLVLGDPTNAHFVDEVQGVSGFGGISGYIVITVWPTSRVLDRLEAIVVHELHHNVRYSPVELRGIRRRSRSVSTSSPRGWPMSSRLNCTDRAATRTSSVTKCAPMTPCSPRSPAA